LEQAPPHGEAKRTAQRVAHVEHRLTGQPSREQPVLQQLHVIRAELSDAHISEDGLQVQTNDVTVAL